MFTSDVPQAFKNWTANFVWLSLNENNKAICKICTRASNEKLVNDLSSHEIIAKQAWVEEGFSGWKNAKRGFTDHTKSSLHIASVEATTKADNSITVYAKISDEHRKQQLQHRVALQKIFSTLNVLALQGLPLRGVGNDTK